MTVADERLASSDPAARRGIGTERHVGPAVHVTAERQRLAALRWKNFGVRRLGVTLGAEIQGLDITTELPDEVIDELRQALYEYKVIFFRDQPLSPQRHVAFAQRFGELEVHPFIPSNSGQPELVRFEKSESVGGYENRWHHDVTWRQEPSMGAVLHAIEVPEVGGDTLFSDMYAAYDWLDDETKQAIDGLYAAHDYMRALGRQVPADRVDEVRARYPIVEHPVVIRHHATGRKLLYVNAVFTLHLVGVAAERSEALLAELYKAAAVAEHQVRFSWQKDSVAFWDNRAVQHYAASDYWPETRVMERASIKGPRPAA